MKPAYVTVAIISLLLIGCDGGSPDGGAGLEQSVSTRDQETTETGSDMDDIAPAPASAPPPPMAAAVYSAKITKVDVSAGDDSRYDVEVMFTSAQGRDFTAVVSSDQGNLVHTESITDVPDAYYAHVFSFYYSGKLSDLNVEVFSPEEKTVLDKWDL